MHLIIRLITAATLLMLVFPAPQALSMPLSEQKVLYAAQQAGKKGKPEYASKLLEHHIRTHRAPGSEMYLALGNIYQDAGRQQDAENMYRRGLKIHPDASSLLINLAIICADDHRFSEAGSLFARAAAKNRSDNLTYQAAAAYFQGEAYPKALSLLRALIKKSGPPRDEWLQLMIHVCMETRDFKLAQGTLHRILKRNPAGKVYWKLLSSVHMEQKEYRKAASAMELALALPGTTHQEWRELGGLYLWIGAPIEAATCYEKGLGDTPKAEWLDLLARCYDQAGRPDRACDVLDWAMSIAPSREHLLRKIRIRYRSGDYDRCQADARSCVQRFGEDAEARYLAGICAVGTGKWEEAAGSFRAAMEDERFRESTEGYLQIMEGWTE